MAPEEATSPRSHVTWPRRAHLPSRATTVTPSWPSAGHGSHMAPPSCTAAKSPTWALPGLEPSRTGCPMAPLALSRTGTRLLVVPPRRMVAPPPARTAATHSAPYGPAALGPAGPLAGLPLGFLVSSWPPIASCFPGHPQRHWLTTWSASHGLRAARSCTGAPPRTGLLPAICLLVGAPCAASFAREPPSLPFFWEQGMGEALMPPF